MSVEMILMDSLLARAMPLPARDLRAPAHARHLPARALPMLASAFSYARVCHACFPCILLTLVFCCRTREYSRERPCTNTNTRHSCQQQCFHSPGDQTPTTPFVRVLCAVLAPMVINAMFRSGVLGAASMKQVI